MFVSLPRNTRRGFLRVITVLVFLHCHLIHIWGVYGRKGDEFQLSRFCSNGVVGGEESETVRAWQDGIVSLHGRGQHRTLRYNFELRDSVPLMKNVDVAIVHTLPAVWFIDPFEANRVVGENRSVFESHILGHVDIESIEMFSNDTSHVLVVSNVSLHEQMVHIDTGIRIHARYARVSKGSVVDKRNVWKWLLSDMVPVVFDPFVIYVRSQTGHCTRILPVQEALSTEVPAGAERHTDIVVRVTAVSIVLGFFFTIHGCWFIQNS